jgi:hypothetical protein
MQLIHKYKKKVVLLRCKQTGAGPVNEMKTSVWNRGQPKQEGD